MTGVKQISRDGLVQARFLARIAPVQLGLQDLLDQLVVSVGCGLLIDDRDEQVGGGQLLEDRREPRRSRQYMPLTDISSSTELASMKSTTAGGCRHSTSSTKYPATVSLRTSSWRRELSGSGEVWMESAASCSPVDHPSVRRCTASISLSGRSSPNRVKNPFVSSAENARSTRRGALRPAPREPASDSAAAVGPTAWPRRPAGQRARVEELAEEVCARVETKWKSSITMTRAPARPWMSSARAAMASNEASPSA